jgi:hypothetical protein
MPQRLFTLVALAFLVGCGHAAPHRPAALPSGPVPYDGQLVRGKLVRAIVQVYDEHTLSTVLRKRRRESSVEFVSFRNAPDFLPDPSGTMVVFRPVGSSSYHTPDDAQGSHYWLEEHECELVRVEQTSREAIDAARACLQQSGDSSAYDLEDPFATGPSARGRWIVHFPDRPPLLRTPSGIELEIDAARHCEVRPLR